MWLITQIQDKGASHYYRFFVQGENLYLDRQPFYWNVRNIADARYVAHPNANNDVFCAVERAKTVGAR